MGKIEIVPKCITCDAEGHTYQDCPRVPFTSLMAGTFQVADLLGPPKAEVAMKLMAIELEKHRKSGLAKLTWEERAALGLMAED